MAEHVSLKFIKEDKEIKKNASRIAGEFRSRMALEGPEGVVLSSFRENEDICLKGRFVEGEERTLWIQKKDLQEYTIEEKGRLTRGRTVKTEEKVQIKGERIFTHEGKEIAVRDMEMNVLASVKGEEYSLSKTHLLVKTEEKKLVMYGIESMEEEKRVDISEKGEFFVFGDIIVIIEDGKIRIIREIETVLSLSIDIEEEGEETARYIVNVVNGLGPIKHMFIVGHTQSIDIEYITVTEEGTKKYYFEEDSDGMGIPLGQSLQNIYVLESTVLPDVNLEEDEIIQGPSVALETEREAILYDIMLKIDNPEEYRHTRRGKEPEMHAEEEIHEEQLLGKEETGVAKKEERVIKAEKEELIKDQKEAAKPENIEIGINKDIKEERKEEEKTSSIENIKNAEELNKNVLEEKIEGKNKADPSPISLSSLRDINLLSKTVDGVEKKSTIEKPEGLLDVQKEKDRDEITSSVKKLDEMAIVDKKMEKFVDEASPIASKLEKMNITNLQAKEALPKESSFERIQKMLDEIDKSVKNPIIAVKEHIKEINEILSTCGKDIEGVEVPKSIQPIMNIKSLLMEVEEALIIMKNEQIALTERVEERDISQEKNRILLQIIHDRMEAMERAIDRPATDFSQEINYLNRRITKLFDISRHTKGKSSEKITLNGTNIYENPLQLNVNPIHKIEDSVILPHGRDSTLNILGECLDKIRGQEKRSKPVEDSIIEHIFKTPAEKSFLNSIRLKKPQEAQKEKKEAESTQEPILPKPVVSPSPLASLSTQNSPILTQPSLSVKPIGMASLAQGRATPMQSMGIITSKPTNTLGSIFSAGQSQSQPTASVPNQPLQSTGQNPLLSQQSTLQAAGMNSILFSSQAAPQNSLFSSQAAPQSSLFSSQAIPQNGIGSTTPLPQQTTLTNAGQSTLFPQQGSGQSTLFSQQGLGQNIGRSTLFPQQNSGQSTLFSQQGSGQNAGQSLPQNSLIFGNMQQSGNLFPSQGMSTSGSSFINPQENNSFNLLSKQNSSFSQGNRTIGLGGQSSGVGPNTSSLFKKPTDQNNQ